MDVFEPVAGVESAFRPWLPSSSLIARDEARRYSVAEGAAAVRECFRHLQGSEWFERVAAFEAPVSRLGRPDLRVTDLAPAVEALASAAGDSCDSVVLHRSLSRLRYILDRCDEEARTVQEHSFPIRSANDISLARECALRLARQDGFSLMNATYVATVVSELGRNILHYAGEGNVRISAILKDDGVTCDAIRVTAEDHGPGIPNLEVILSGSYRSKTGMGLGLLGSKRLLDEFQVKTSPGGTTVTGLKYAPGH
jgi:serine/threonine-protein kinase RsbT